MLILIQSSLFQAAGPAQHSGFCPPTKSTIFWQIGEKKMIVSVWWMRYGGGSCGGGRVICNVPLSCDSSSVIATYGTWPLILLLLVVVDSLTFLRVLSKEVKSCPLLNTIRNRNFKFQVHLRCPRKTVIASMIHCTLLAWVWSSALSTALPSSHSAEGGVANTDWAWSTS